jgi:hypothetical protein
MAVNKPAPTEPDMGFFEGREVSGVKIIITKTGDGLSKAMEVDPKILHQGDIGYIVLSYVTNKIRFDSPKDDEDETTARIQILEATGATFVDRDLIGDVVEVMRDRIEAHAEELRIAKEEAKGVYRLHAEDDPDEDED